MSMRDARKGGKSKKGVVFNIMLVGRSGLGKSTLLKTMLGTDLSAPDEPSDLPPTTDVIPVTQELEINDQKFILTVVDTPGFGDSIDSSQDFAKIVAYINDQYYRMFGGEFRFNRKAKPEESDTCVHAVLYLIAPTGHSLKELDIEAMKQISQVALVIPVIAKADSLSSKELATFKRRIIEDLEHHKISVYNFPADSDDDDETIAEYKALRKAQPFAVIGSTQTYDVNGVKARGRKYPWGVVEVDNPNHCDYHILFDVLFGSHMRILKEVTIETFYGQYRQDTLAKRGTVDAMKIEDEMVSLEKADNELRQKQMADRERKKSGTPDDWRSAKPRLDSVAATPVTPQIVTPSVATPTGDEEEGAEDGVEKKKKKKERLLDANGEPIKKKKSSKTEDGGEGGAEGEEKEKKKKKKREGTDSAPETPVA